MVFRGLPQVGFRPHPWQPLPALPAAAETTASPPVRAREQEREEERKGRRQEITRKCELFKFSCPRAVRDVPRSDLSCGVWSPRVFVHSVACTLRIAHETHEHTPTVHSRVGTFRGVHNSHRSRDLRKYADHTFLRSSPSSPRGEGPHGREVN